MNGYKTKMYLKYWISICFRYVFLIGLSFIIIYPIFLTVIISFMNSSDIYDSAVRFIPKHFITANYRNAIILLDYAKSLLQSIGLNLLLCIIELASCMLIAYGFARFHFKGSSILFGAVILTLLVPGNIYFVPLYLHLQE